MLVSGAKTGKRGRKKEKREKKKRKKATKRRVLAGSWFDPIKKKKNLKNPWINYQATDPRLSFVVVDFLVLYVHGGEMAY